MPPVNPDPRSAPHGSRADLFGTIADDVADILRRPLFQYLAATAAALVILFARAPVAGVMPELFAEDGAWTSRIYTRGFADAVFHGRRGADYPVFGNVLLLWLGMRWCDLVHGGDLLALAGDCARVCYLAFAAAISLPVLLLRRQLPGLMLPAVWLLACFLPLGLHDRSPSGFEILGRASNAGFLCLYVGFVLAWHRLANVTGRTAALGTDLGLLACAATNPLCHAILPLTAWPWWRRVSAVQRRPWRLVADRLFPWGLVAALVLVMVVGLPTAQAKRLPVTAAPLDTDALVEIGLARSMLYAVVWPWYGQLSTARTALVALAVPLLAWCVALPRHRPVLLGGGLLMGLASATLVRFRPELADSLGGYRSTFPDRYFYGQHLVALPLLALVTGDAAARLQARGAAAWLPWAALGALAITAAIREPAWVVPHDPLSNHGRSHFAVRLAEALRDRRFVDADLQPDPAGRFLEVPNPDGRPKRLVVPREPARRAVDRVRHLARRGQPDASGMREAAQPPPGTRR